jgi:hypothetical protein
MVAAPAMSLSMRPEFARPLMISLKKSQLDQIGLIRRRKETLELTGAFNVLKLLISCILQKWNPESLTLLAPELLFQLFTSYF